MRQGFVMQANLHGVGVGSERDRHWCSVLCQQMKKALLGPNVLHVLQTLVPCDNHTQNLLPTMPLGLGNEPPL